MSSTIILYNFVVSKDIANVCHGFIGTNYLDEFLEYMNHSLKNTLNAPEMTETQKLISYIKSTYNGYFDLPTKRGTDANRDFEIIDHKDNCFMDPNNSFGVFATKFSLPINIFIGSTKIKQNITPLFCKKFDNRICIIYEFLTPGETKLMNQISHDYTSAEKVNIVDLIDSVILSLSDLPHIEKIRKIRNMVIEKNIDLMNPLNLEINLNDDVWRINTPHGITLIESDDFFDGRYGIYFYPVTVKQKQYNTIVFPITIYTDVTIMTNC
ncbi:hypothetical protein Catovirus_1_602 [Catovirus CTV1]|uniref:Uncharacterized protein n=1 Tax=Catovirus CTV1 TaxID=1977631 RepID=A0A1V0SA21_9VIRU|nr:hypothetical protein Catovirus_1_602 [Catovirus CTV1]